MRSIPYTKTPKSHSLLELEAGPRDRKSSLIEALLDCGWITYIIHFLENSVLAWYVEIRDALL